MPEHTPPTDAERVTMTYPHSHPTVDVLPDDEGFEAGRASATAPVRPTPAPEGIDPGQWANSGPVPLYALLDLWTALGHDSSRFEAWYFEQGYADAHAELLAMVRRRASVTEPKPGVWSDPEPWICEGVRADTAGVFHTGSPLFKPRTREQYYANKAPSAAPWIDVIARTLRPDDFWNLEAEYTTMPREDAEAGVQVARFEAEQVLVALREAEYAALRAVPRPSRDDLARIMHERLAPEFTDHWDDLEEYERADSEYLLVADAILAAASAVQPVQVPAAKLEPDTDHSSSVDTREDEEVFVDPECCVGQVYRLRSQHFDYPEVHGMEHKPRTRAEYEADQEG